MSLPRRSTGAISNSPGAHPNRGRSASRWEPRPHGRSNEPACYKRPMSSLEGQGRFVAASLRLLQFVEQRRPTGRRFGADADARWGSFKGDLLTAHRIELLIRDADAEWPGAFGARSVYDLRGIAEDEPFGSQWAGVDPIEAEELWRALRGQKAPESAKDVLRAIADA